MGRNKFHLVARKNQERKKYAATKPVCLEVSIPRAKLPFHNIASLDCQLRALNALPPSWTLSTGSNEAGMTIVLCCLDACHEPPTIRYSITVRQDFTWLLNVMGKTVVPNSCRALSTTPLRLSGVVDNALQELRFNSVHELVQLTLVVETCKVCEGNLDDKFMEVAKRRDGVFKNSDGEPCQLY